jgi:hypothetical protein
LYFELPLKSKRDFTAGLSRAIFSFSFVLSDSFARSLSESSEDKGLIETTKFFYSLIVLSCDNSSVGINVMSILGLGLDRRISDNFLLIVAMGL